MSFVDLKKNVETIHESSLLGQDNIKSFFKDILTEVATDVYGDKEIKTSAIVLAVRGLIGSNPIVDRSNPNVNIIKFTKTQRLKLENYFDKKAVTETGKPSNVKIEHASLWKPYAIRKAMPYLIGAAIIGILAGRYIK